MNKLNLNYTITIDKLHEIITVMGMTIIMFYMIVSLRNIIEVIFNFSLLSQSSNVASIILNIVLYLFVILTGVEAVRKSRNPYYQILAFIAILIIY